MASIPYLYRKLRGYGVPHAAAILMSDPDHETEGGGGGGTGPAGRGIESIARTTGNGAPGTVDIYTITYTDETTSTYQVRNGADGTDGEDGTDGTSGTNDYTELINVPTQFTPAAHTHTAANISDSTSTGRNVLTAASQANARGAIGAGTSNLAVGTTAADAKAGNWTPAEGDIPNLPASKTTSGRFALARMDTSVPSFVSYSGSAWPSRPSGASQVVWVDRTGDAPDPAEAVVGTDLLLRAAE